MSQSKQKLSTGFRKGFLLSSTNKSKTRAKPKPKVSSALLDVEEQAESPLLLMTQNEEPSEQISEASREPLHVFISKDNDDDHQGSSIDFGLTEVSTTRRRNRRPPLIEEVSIENKTIKEIRSPVLIMQSKQVKPLLTEVQCKPVTPLALPRSISDCVSEITMKPCTIAIDSILPVDTHPKEVRASMNTPNAQLVHELPRILWKLQERQSVNEDRVLLHQFISECIQTGADWAFAWSFILKTIAEDPSGRKGPSVRLGTTLLQQNEGLESFVLFLMPSDDKHSRVLALGSAALIHCYCESMRETKTSIANEVWLTQVLPRLSKIVLASTTKRSVLSHQCMTAAYEIVAALTGQKDAIALLNLESILWNTLSIMDELLQVQQGWMETSLASTKCPTANSTVDASRKKCTLAVVNDWRLVIKEVLRLHEAILVESGGQSDDARLRLTEYTCLQLTGASSDGFEPAGFGGLFQTMSTSPPKLTAEQVVMCLQGGTQLLRTIRDRKESEEIQSWQKERLRAILRGAAAWLGQSKRHLQSLSKQSDVAGTTNLRQATDLCVVLLRCDTDESITLVLAILDNLWSSSDGLPPDFAHSESDAASSTVPTSFELLLDELKRDSIKDATVLEPTQKVFCILVTRCIQHRGSSLVKELVERNGTSPSTVEVLANILSGTEQVSPDNNTDLMMTAGSSFLDCIGVSRYAQRKLSSSPALLCTLPTAMVVPRLVALADSNMNNNDIVTPVAASLAQLLASSLRNEVVGFVHDVVESLGRCDEETLASDVNESSQNKNGRQEESMRSSRLCRKITGTWRRMFLQNPVCGIDGFALVLSAVADAMFADPSSSIPLALLGSIVGDELSPLMDSNDDQVSRVYLAVIIVVRQSLNELDKSDDAGRNSVTNGNTETIRSIYSRLSPLLLLRRIPSGYYRVAWNSNSTDHKELERLLERLADQLSDRLNITRLSNLRVTFSAEERRLAAELAGRCLPFSVPSSCSCYQRICYPAFSSALQTLQAIPFEQESLLPESLRAARAALYASCNHVPLADDDEVGEGVYATISFVLGVLNVDVAQAVDQKVNEDDLIQLQTGCIEFIAVCLESTLQRYMKNRGKQSASRFVVEMEVSPTHSGGGSVPTVGEQNVSTREALSTSCSSIASLLRTEAAIPCRLRLSDNGFSLDSSRDTNQEPSTSARTCIWNGFLVVCQRCQDGNLLSCWANLTAPWVLDWASLAPVDANLRHPLCMAAALQVLFVLVTRTKSFDCLAGGKATPRSVLKAHRLAIASIKSEYKVGGDYARTTMRKAGLKLLLALVTIDQIDNSNSLPSCLSPGELGETFTLLNGTANMDADAEVRALAGHLLGAIRIVLEL